MLPAGDEPLADSLVARLERAVTEGWTRRQLRAAVAAFRGKADGTPEGAGPATAAPATNDGTDQTAVPATAPKDHPNDGAPDAAPAGGANPEQPDDGTLSAATVLAPGQPEAGDESTDKAAAAPAAGRRAGGRPKATKMPDDPDAGWQLNTALREVEELVVRLLEECPQAQQPAFAEAVQQMTERVLGGVAAEA